MTAVGLAGFGSSGRGIHAPLLQQAGMTIAAVSTADPQRSEQVRKDLPGARVVADLEALLAVSGLDLIVLATPSGIHAGQARKCIGAGIAVVVDKPLATDATQALGVVEAARAADVALTVFQNRRFDAEHVAARETVRSGRLGEVFRHEFRWECWRPTPKDRWRENASAARALATKDPQAAMPVDPSDAVHTLAVIDAARASAAQGTVEQVRTPGQRCQVTDLAEPPGV